MRILIVNKFARITGGADAYCLDLVDALRGRGHAVALLSTSDPANHTSDGAFIPATVTREDRSSLAARGQMRVASAALWNQTAYSAMRELIRDFRPDVVSAHKLYPQLSVSPLIAAARARIPVVQTVHDYEFVSASPLDDSGRWLDRDEVALRFRALNSSLFVVKRGVHRRTVARWVAVSAFVASRLKASGIDADVVPNPAPEPDARPAVFESRRGLLYAGRLTREKGIAHVLRLAELTPDLEITVAGDGPERPLVEMAAARLPNLRFVGFVDREELSDLLVAARAVAMPSLWEEPGALVALESMAHGTPLVVYRAGGVAEYVESTGAGLVVAHDPESLAAVCSHVVRTKAIWEALSTAGIAAAAGPHSSGAHCAALEHVFAKAAPLNGGSPESGL